MFLAVSIAFAVLMVNAFYPVKKEPFTVISFVLGWIPGELPVQVGVVEVAACVAFGIVGALHGWPGWAGVVIAAVSLAGYVRLTVVAHQAGALVDQALACATEHGTVTAIGHDGVDPKAAWNRWWRLSIAVPFRWLDIKRTRNIDYWGDADRRHTLDVLSRRRVRPEGAPVLVYVHGGAWVMGEKRQQGIPMMHELVRRGWVCVSINYRLSPKATWPDQIVDCKRAVAWVRGHIGEYGGDPSFIAVSGGSAGGHLSSLLALTPNQPHWQPGFEEMDTSVDACLPFYGVYDMTVDPRRGGAYGRGLVELLERRVMKTTMRDDRLLFEQASPDQQVTADAPPMFVFHGVNDTLVPVAVARYFVDRLREVSGAPVAYVELPRAQHTFDVLASIRCRHTSMGAVRFLEAMRARAENRPAGRPVPAQKPG